MDSITEDRSATRVEELELWRERAFRFVLYLTLAFGLPPLLLWSGLKADDGRLPVTLPIWVVYAVFVGLALGRRIRWRLRAGVFLSGLFVGGLVPLVEYGFNSQGALLLLSAMVASTVLLGTRAGIFVLVLSLLSVTTTGALFVTGALVGNPAHLPDSLATWLSFGGTLSFLSVSLVATVGVLMRRLETSLGSSRARVLTLEKEVKEVDAERAATSRELDERVVAAGVIADRERAQRAANAELELRIRAEEDKLSQLSDELKAFSYTVSHDLRAPVRQVGAFAEMLRESSGRALGPEGLRQLDAIEGANRRMASMIDDLLRFHAAGWLAISETEFELRPLVEEVIDDLMPGVAGREVDWDVARLPRVRGDRALMKQVFSNLLDNALKFTRPRARAKVDIGVRDARDELAVFVRDNGVGFDPVYASRLFHVFQRLHAAHEFPGSGVGLAHVKRIVDRHGGRVWAEGAVDGGATFYVVLRTPEPNREIGAPAPTDPPA